MLEVKLFISDYFDIEMRKSYGLLSLSTIILFITSLLPLLRSTRDFLSVECRTFS